MNKRLSRQRASVACAATRSAAAAALGLLLVTLRTPTVHAECRAPASDAALAALSPRASLSTTASNQIQRRSQLVELDQTSAGAELVVLSHQLPDTTSSAREWTARVEVFRCEQERWTVGGEQTWTETTEPSDDQPDFVSILPDQNRSSADRSLHVQVRSLNWEHDPRHTRVTEQWLVLTSAGLHRTLSLVMDEDIIAGPARASVAALHTTMRWVTPTRIDVAVTRAGAHAGVCRRTLHWTPNRWVSNRAGCIE